MEGKEVPDCTFQTETSSSSFYEHTPQKEKHKERIKDL